MLQILGDKLKGMVTWTIVLLIAVVFVFLGLNDYFSSSEQSVIAKVNGQKIMRKTVESLYERFAAQQNTTVDAEALKKQVVNTLIRRAALLSEVQALELETSDEQVVEMLFKIPAFQVEGEFSKDQYQKVLAQMGYTDASFRKELAENGRLGQFEQGIVQSSFSTPQALQRIVALVEQKRDVGYLQLPANHYRKKTPVNEQEIDDFYEKNKQNFISPEAVSLEYVRLSLDPFIKKIVLSSEEISDYYKEHQSDYTLPERVHARHLLISVPPGHDPKVEKEAMDRVEGLLKQLKGGADFSALAKRWSADSGSAKKGGDLGWMTKGQMVPSFEEAAFHLKPGAYSEAIRTDFGYHIIQVVAHKNPEVRSLVAVAPAITEQLSFQRAQEQFEKTKETLEKLALEQQDTSTLLPIATDLGLQVQQTALFSAVGDGEGVIADPMVRKVAFSEAFIKQGFSAQPVLLSDQSIVVMRLKQHNPAHQQTLAEAQKTVREQVLNAKMQARLQAFSDSFVKRVQGGENPAVLAKEQGLVWHTKKNVSRQAGLQNELLSAGFQLSPLDPGEKLKIGKFVLQDGSYGLLVLYKVVPGQWSGLEPSAQQAYNSSLTDISGTMDYITTIGHVLGSATIQWLGGSIPQ